MDHLAADTLINGIIFPSNASAYTLAGTSIELGGTVINQSANDETISLPLQLVGGGGTFDTWPAGLTVSGPISGSGPLAKSGSGTLTLAGSGWYTGGTSVEDGLLVIDSSEAIPSGSTIATTVNAAVVLGDPSLPSDGTSVGGLAPGAPARSTVTNSEVISTPEPSTVALLLAASLGFAGVVFHRRRGAPGR
jgi:autotransporter-associated beta strand protein